MISTSATVIPESLDVGLIVETVSPQIAKPHLPGNRF